MSLIHGLWRLSNMWFFFFCLSCSLLALLASTVDWLLCILYTRMSMENELGGWGEWYFLAMEGQCGLAFTTYIFGGVQCRNKCWMQLTAGNSEQMHVSVTPEFLSMRENWHSKCDCKLIFLNVIDMYVHTYICTSRVVLDHNNSKLVFITLNNNLYSCSMPYECQPWVDITSDEFSQPSPSVSPTGSD